MINTMPFGLLIFSPLGFYLRATFIQRKIARFEIYCEGEVF